MPKSSFFQFITRWSKEKLQCFDFRPDGLEGRRELLWTLVLAVLNITHMNTAWLARPVWHHPTPHSVQEHNQTPVGLPLSETIGGYTRLRPIHVLQRQIMLHFYKQHFNRGVIVLFYLSMKCFLRVSGLFVDKLRLKGCSVSLYLLSNGSAFNTPGVNLLQLC